jgi:hypothetical protein
MGRNALIKANRKAGREATAHPAPPNYVAVAKLPVVVRRNLQRERDRALNQAKRQYEATALAIRTQYFETVKRLSEPAL